MKRKNEDQPRRFEVTNLREEREEKEEVFEEAGEEVGEVC
jgi:hypothetical protein